jgi:hypothetical protein
MKFKLNHAVIYDSIDQSKVVKETLIDKCNLKCSIFPSYYGFRLYWEFKVISDGIVMITEGPVGSDCYNLNFLDNWKWFETKIGSDMGQIIVEYDDGQESGDNLSVCWNLLKKGEINIRCQMPWESKRHLAIAAKVFFEGISCNTEMLSIALQMIPKRWKIQLRHDGYGRTVIHPLNFNAITKQLTSR